MSHLIPKPLVALPYVDGIPDPSQRPDQRRIEWVRNGECLGGAAHVSDNGGELNRGPVQIQRNVDTLDNNNKTIESSLVEIINRVNNHDDVLGEIGDDNLATKVDALEKLVEPMDSSIISLNQRLFLVSELAESTKTEVGDRDALDITDRKVMGDLFFVKKQLGNWQDKDINENDSPGTEATGMKYRLTQHGLNIADNTRRITRLEEDWTQSDVGALTARVDDIRGELGRTADAPTLGVYTWIKLAKAKHDKYDEDIKTLQDDVGSVGGKTINERVTDNANNISSNTTIINGHTQSISNIQTAIGDGSQPQSIVGKLEMVETKTNRMDVILGPTEADGMRKKVQDVVDEVGSDQLATSLKGRMFNAETNISASQRDISAMKLQIGDATPGAQTGIYRSINNLNKAVLTPSTGLVDLVAKLEVDKVDEAPEDGKKYVRMDGDWAEFTGGGSGDVEEAPMDGKSYVRNNGAWVIENSEDIAAQPNKKFVIMTSPTDSKNAISIQANKIVFGDASMPTTLAGTLENVKVKDEFQISNSDGKTILHSRADEFVIGALPSDNIGLVFRGDTRVEVAGTRYAVWHAGNFADNASDTPSVRKNNQWVDLATQIPQRKKGGFYTINADKETMLTKDVAEQMSFGDDPKDVTVDGGFVRDGISLSYVADAPIIAFVSFEMYIETSANESVVLELYKNGVSTGRRYNIESDEWPANKRHGVTVQCPQSAKKGDVFTVMATATTQDCTLTVKDGTFYAFEI